MTTLPSSVLWVNNQNLPYAKPSNLHVNFFFSNMHFVSQFGLMGGYFMHLHPSIAQHLFFPPVFQDSKHQYQSGIMAVGKGNFSYLRLAGIRVCLWPADLYSGLPYKWLAHKTPPTGSHHFPIYQRACSYVKRRINILPAGCFNGFFKCCCVREIQLPPRSLTLWELHNSCQILFFWGHNY